MSLQSWYFWPLVVLFIAQLVLSVNYQILICNIPLANTLLLLVSLSFKKEEGENSPVQLFHRIAGCVAFLAVMFVNTTHALEMLTETIDDTPSEHHHGHDTEGEFPAAYLYLSIVDILMKGVLLMKGCLPSFSLSIFFQIVLHSLGSAVFLLLNFLSHFAHLEHSWWWEHLNPVSTVIVTVVSIALLFPSYKFLKPFVFADTPTFFDSEKLKNEVVEKFANAKIDHIHVFSVWPKHSFEAIIHLQIKVDKSSHKWPREGEQTYNSVSQHIRESLGEYPGTKTITIEPHFVNSLDANAHWQSCTDRKCENRERTCCGRRERNANTTSAA